MGFRTGAYAKVWEVKPFSDTSVKLRLSVSRKNKQTGEYEQDFSGYVNAVGTAAAKKAACLKEGDRIKLGDVDVTTKYDPCCQTQLYQPLDGGATESSVGGRFGRLLPRLLPREQR